MNNQTFTVTIGLEVHVELATVSKMFCGCANDPHGSAPNANICPVCLAHPGTLPVPNEEAIAKVLLFGTAVGATIATYSEFDRKNYFYPDIPKAYQISQYAFPFLTGGELCGVKLTRVHLEEDTARSQHDKGEHSLVDFNRAGVPLMELVTEPVIHDAATAGAFARELQLILRTLGISSAQMEKGEMRVEANISVSNDPVKLGTKVEVKNLNSFRSVESAIAYEVERQVTLIMSGGVVKPETRGWDEVKLRTFMQRSKETAKDYRYFPDPDIPKLIVHEYEQFSPSRINEKMKVLPEEKRLKYKNIGLTISQIEVIISNETLDTLFASVYAVSAGKDASAGVLTLTANYLTSDILAHLTNGVDCVVSPEHLYELMSMAASKEITSRVAKDLLAEVMKTDANPRELAMSRNLLRASSEDSLGDVVQQVIAANPGVVAEYKSGKKASIQFLIGQGMKLSRGTADPAVLAKLLEEELQ